MEICGSLFFCYFFPLARPPVIRTPHSIPTTLAIYSDITTGITPARVVAVVECDPPAARKADHNRECFFQGRFHIQPQLDTYRDRVAEAGEIVCG